MSRHESDGQYVAVHSVCVAASHRRQGIALNLMRSYLSRLESGLEHMGRPKVRGVRLIAHEELVPLYQKAGFELVGLSEVSHGARPWYEMKLDFQTQL